MLRWWDGLLLGLPHQLWVSNQLYHRSQSSRAPSEYGSSLKKPIEQRSIAGWKTWVMGDSNMNIASISAPYPQCLQMIVWESIQVAVNIIIIPIKPHKTI